MCRCICLVSLDKFTEVLPLIIRGLLVDNKHTILRICIPAVARQVINIIATIQLVSLILFSINLLLIQLRVFLIEKKKKTNLAARKHTCVCILI